jgi:hypothetical protein
MANESNKYTIKAYRNNSHTMDSGLGGVQMVLPPLAEQRQLKALTLCPRNSAHQKHMCPKQKCLFRNPFDWAIRVEYPYPHRQEGTLDQRVQAEIGYCKCTEYTRGCAWGQDSNCQWGGIWAAAGCGLLGDGLEGQQLLEQMGSQQHQLLNLVGWGRRGGHWIAQRERRACWQRKWIDMGLRSHWRSANVKGCWGLCKRGIPQGN